MHIKTPQELSHSVGLLRNSVRRLRSTRQRLRQCGWSAKDIAYVLEAHRTFLLGVLEDIQDAKRRGIRLPARIA